MRNDSSRLIFEPLVRRFLISAPFPMADVARKYLQSPFTRMLSRPVAPSRQTRRKSMAETNPYSIFVTAAVHRSLVSRATRRSVRASPAEG